MSSQLTDDEARPRSSPASAEPAGVRRSATDERVPGDLHQGRQAARRGLGPCHFTARRDWARRRLRILLSHEMGSAIRSTSGLVLSHAGDLAAILTNLQEQDMLFIDEIHRLRPRWKSPVSGDGRLSNWIWSSGKGASTRTVKLELPRFTLVGATTSRRLTSPLRDQFGLVAPSGILFSPRNSPPL